MFFFYFPHFACELVLVCGACMCVCGVCGRLEGGDWSQFAVAGCCPFAPWKWLMNYKIITQWANRPRSTSSLFGHITSITTLYIYKIIIISIIKKPISDWVLVNNALRVDDDHFITVDSSFTVVVQYLPQLLHRFICGLFHLWALT